MVEMSAQRRKAYADVDPRRQRTQYTCAAASIAMAFHSLGRVRVTEDVVAPHLLDAEGKGASWESMIGVCQFLGGRATMVAPALLSDVRRATDAGQAVVIAWNPNNRPWSHASVVIHVTDTHVEVADPNLPNPDQLTRTLTHDEFYAVWYEQWSDFLFRRPALFIENEVNTMGQPTRKASSLDAALRRLSDRASEEGVTASGGTALDAALASVLKRLPPVTLEEDVEGSLDAIQSFVGAQPAISPTLLDSTHSILARLMLVTPRVATATSSFKPDFVEESRKAVRDFVSDQASSLARKHGTASVAEVLGRSSRLEAQVLYRFLPGVELRGKSGSILTFEG